MNDIPSWLYTVVFAICVFAAAILGNRQSRAGKRFVYFTAFLVIQSACFAFELLMSHPATPFKALWLGLRLGAALFIAPCLWLALQEIVYGERPKPTSLGRTALGCIALGLTLAVPLIATTHSGPGYFNPERTLSAGHTRFIHGTMLACIFIFAVQAPYYLWRCRALLLEQQQLEAPFDRASKGAATGWLHLPLAIVFTTWIVGLLRTLYCATLGARQDLVPLFALLESGVAVGALYQIVHRASTPEARAARQETASLPPPSASLAESTEPKYAKSNLGPALRERIKLKLEKAMTVDALYSDSLLSLRSLSTAIKENAHYVSQVINQDLNRTFYEFVSQHRIARAKELLRAHPNQNVLDTAFAVGFNSKSTFNTAFRRETGMTPSEFRASIGRGAAEQAARKVTAA